MRGTHLSLVEAVRSLHRASAERRDPHGTQGFSPPFSGDRGSALRPGLARLDGVLHACELMHGDPRPLSGGRQRSSGTRAADGGDIGATGGRSAAQGLRFDGILPHGGYAWWYVDALSDDGDYGLTVIAFLGSVFSPYYARARRETHAGPLNHCAFNVALYGRGAARWAMTERGVRQVARGRNGLAIGPSIMRWDGSALEIAIHERCAPIPWPLRGKIRVYPGSLPGHSYALDAAGKHVWTPIAPSARVEAVLSSPDIKWSGSGYFDSNRGTEPLETAFRDWTWSRIADGDTSVVLYDVGERDRARTSLALKFAPSGEAISIPPPPSCSLPASGWRIARHTRADPGYSVRVRKTLVDAPFYSRTLLDTRVAGVEGRSVHESLDLDRFRSPWVQCLLPFRMPRMPF
jgi:carotenoid 1,2-hydratase